ncbi:globin-coupled sensor protein [Paenibacillus xylaniclasticus]|uniref:globin-coupled sensor protein n=1 Tax=Paenibacillus xylaniclasticus TaxID=588083 RepID=UPI0017783030|nr:MULTISPECIES: globin-coupled sensor protein [Paenibacillus]GFN31549.1 heme-based aerotactic transducer HemAT [Paenibacillus curdlanolyticus]
MDVNNITVPLSGRQRIRLTDSRRRQLSYIGISEEDLALMHDQQTLFCSITNEVVDELYNRLLQEPELADFIQKHSSLERLKETQRWYFQSLTDGVIDEPFIERRIQIGSIHSRIGLTSNWYLGTYMLYLDLAAKHIEQAEPANWTKIVLVLSKLFNFDSQLVLEAYEKGEKGKIQQLVDQKQHMLTRVNTAVQELTTMIAELNESSCSMSEKARHTADLQRSSNEHVQELQRQVRDIGQLGTTMKEVSEQTHLIGLNASIEAARAGDEGRGFAVVANEIRKLAANSKQSLDIIQSKLDSIYKSLAQVESGSKQTLQLADGQAASSQELSAFVQMIDKVARELKQLQSEQV